VRPGGVAADLAPGGSASIRRLITEIRQRWAELVTIYDDTASLQDRTVGAGILRPEFVALFSCGGFVGRASGRAVDARRRPGYPPYDELSFEIPVRHEGDVDARVWVRISEVEQSLALIQQILNGLPAGPVRIEVQPADSRASREGMALVEGFRGDILVWVRLIDRPLTDATPPLDEDAMAQLAQSLARTARRRLGRSLAIREVDAGSCNGCEVEIVGLNSPVYDVERFGIHFVASPRHADMLLVTGPVTRNMELALKKTYEATPGPRLVVAVGACGCSGGIFGVNYATVGGVDAVVPVDVYIPGCPPNPHALLQGILLAMGRLANR
jgi:Ni,Fe-hydrogenase III small subunit